MSKAEKQQAPLSAVEAGLPTKIFSPIFGKIYGPNERDMIGDLEKFMKRKIDGAITLDEIYAEMCSPPERPDYTFLKMSGRLYLMLGDGFNELTAMEVLDGYIPKIYAITRYAKRADKIWARGPLPVDRRFIAKLSSVLIKSFRDGTYYDFCEKGWHKELQKTDFP